MPKGPKGEKRPADAIGAAVMVGKIATGEVEDTIHNARGIQCAKMSLFQRYVQSDIMVHGHAPLMACWG